MTAERAGRPFDITITLPDLWWVTDLRFRQLSVDPRAEFESRPLTPAEKQKYALKADGFAGQVTSIGGFAQMLKVHELKTGDIVYAVDGVERDEMAKTPELFIKLHKAAGDVITLDVIRDGRRMKTQVTTQRMYFRK
jgi:hypothetical protein